MPMQYPAILKAVKKIFLDEAVLRVPTIYVLEQN